MSPARPGRGAGQPTLLPPHLLSLQPWPALRAGSCARERHVTTKLGGVLRRHLCVTVSPGHAVGPSPAPQRALLGTSVRNTPLCSGPQHPGEAPSGENQCVSVFHGQGHSHSSEAASPASRPPGRGHAPSAASSCWGSRCSWARGSVASVSVSGHVVATSSVTCLWASPSGAHITTGAAWALQDLSVSHLQGRVHGGRGRGAVPERASAPRLSSPACDAVHSLPRLGTRPWLCSLSPSLRQRVSSRARP